MAVYKYLEKDNSKVKVESANRDGEGVQIDTNYAKQDGDYSAVGLVSALATNFKTNRGQTSTYPIIFAPSGIVSGSQYADLMTGVQKLNSLRGNSVVLNQLNPNSRASSTQNGITLTNNKDGTWTLNGTATAHVTYPFVTSSFAFTNDHKYLFSLQGFNSSGIQLRINSNGVNINSSNIYIYGGSDVFETSYPRMFVTGGTTLSNKKITFMIFDLTLMFGAGNEPTSVEEFNALFPKPYYEYNAGELLSCQSNKLVSVGYNALSLDRTEGTLIGDDYSRGNAQQFSEGEYYKGLGTTDYVYRAAISSFSIENGVVSVTSVGGSYGVAFPVRVVAGQSYTLEFTSTDTNKWVSWYDESGLFILSNSSQSGIFTAPNNAYWGVIIFGRSAGSWTYSNICFHLTWSGSKTGYEAYYKHEYDLPNVELRKNLATGTYDILYPSGKLIRNVGVRAYQSGDENDSTLTTDKTITYYDLTTPTEEATANTFQENIYVDDYGTLEFESEQTLQVPQGYEILYPIAMNDFLGRLMQRTDVNSSPTNLVSQSELANYLKTLSGYSASKTQTLKNVNGTLQWVDD